MKSNDHLLGTMMSSISDEAELEQGYHDKHDLDGHVEADAGGSEYVEHVHGQQEAVTNVSNIGLHLHDAKPQ